MSALLTQLSCYPAQGRGESHVLLDISHKPRAAVLDHFPNVAAHCASLGVDITQVCVKAIWS